MTNGKKESHDSYGMLQISRVSHGKDTVLYGSSIPHSETIRLSIHPGVVERSISTDWYFTRGREHIEIEMSQSQFAEAITSLNMGSGVPVTIKTLHGEYIENPQFKNKRIQFEEEFKQRMMNLEEKMSQLTENTEDLLRNKKSINKGDRESILREIQNMQLELSSNIPYISAMYNEQLDKTTQEAKAEVEAFTLNKVNQLGLDKLEELKALSNLEPINQIERK